MPHPGADRRHNQGGFSFVEILIGIVILGIVAAAVVMGFTSAGVQIAKSRVDTVSSQLASATLERIRTMDYEDIGIVDGNPGGTLQPTATETVSGNTYTVQTSVEYVDDPTPGRGRNYINYKRVEVTVTADGTGARPITQTTLVAPPSFGAVRGKATAVITVIDAITGDPLPHTAVRLDGSTSAVRNGLTDSEGKVVFAGLEPSNPSPSSPQHAYQATARLAGYETDVDSGPDEIRQSLAASQTWNATIKMYKPVTLAINLRNKETGATVTDPSEVRVTLPAPKPGTQTFATDNGIYLINTIEGRTIRPNADPGTVNATADCYQPGTAVVPLNQGYPSQLTQTVTVDLEPLPRAGRLRLWVVQATDDRPISNAPVQISGGETGYTAPSRTTDGNGYLEFCLPHSVATPYTVSVPASGGYVPGSLSVTIEEGKVTDQIVRLAPDNACTITVRHRQGANQPVRLVGVNSTYDRTLTTNWAGRAAFYPLARGSVGTYNVQVVNGYSDGQPNWVSARTVTCASYSGDVWVP